jgi:hypothetical protein
MTRERDALVRTVRGCCAAATAAINAGTPKTGTPPTPLENGASRFHCVGDRIADHRPVPEFVRQPDRQVAEAANALGGCSTVGEMRVAYRAPGDPESSSAR